MRYDEPPVRSFVMTLAHRRTVLRPADPHPEVPIERVQYDAEAAARHVAAAGLPEDYAEKLLTAA